MKKQKKTPSSIPISRVSLLLLELVDDGKLDYLGARLFNQYVSSVEKNDDLLDLSNLLMCAAQKIRDLKKAKVLE